MKKNQKQKGFTLIEMLVSMMCFSIVIVVITSVFVSSVKSQQTAKDLQNIQDEVRYLMDFISRDIRMADRADGTCGVDNINHIYFVNAGNIQFLKTKPDHSTECITYIHDNINGRILKNFIPINSDKIKITYLKFIQSYANINTDQPRITIILKARALNSTNEITIQTTISTRAR